MQALENITYDELNVGDSVTYTRALSEDEVVLFAAVSGDVNPVHLDPDYAASTPFGERIAHGMLSGAFISAALATALPGPGTIYLEQQLKFRAPVMLRDILTVKLVVAEKQPKNRVLIDCIITNQNDTVVVTGQAKVIAPTEKITLERPRLPRVLLNDNGEPREAHLDDETPE
ncbi:MAG: 3-hydroxybutyryl-CoA dehydratase [Gammaproteobacteria bacterium]|nr:MAG: 3-hydroxybutyryl-CoA dehydratase [Gammaproteobacteria bacterium]